MYQFWILVLTILAANTPLRHIVGIIIDNQIASVDYGD